MHVRGSNSCFLTVDVDGELEAVRSREIGCPPVGIDTCVCTTRSPRSLIFGNRRFAPALKSPIVVPVKESRIVEISYLSPNPAMGPLFSLLGPNPEIDVETQFHDDDLMAYNTLAEIPGTDKVDEIVMIGGHYDAEPAGTGATDNASGAASVMEAMRILKALDLQPRRTIRIALWAGEEQGLLVTREDVAYVDGLRRRHRLAAAAEGPVAGAVPIRPR